MKEIYFYFIKEGNELILLVFHVFNLSRNLRLPIDVKVRIKIYIWHDLVTLLQHLIKINTLYLSFTLLVFFFCLHIFFHILLYAILIIIKFWFIDVNLIQYFIAHSNSRLNTWPSMEYPITLLFHLLIYSSIFYHASNSF